MEIKIKDLEGRLAELLEVPKKSGSVGREIIFGQLATQKMINILTLGSALQCIWDEFAKAWEEKGKSLMEEVNPEVLRSLNSATTNFFSYIIRENPSGSETVREAQREEERILVAIEELRNTLEAGNS